MGSLPLMKTKLLGLVSDVETPTLNRSSPNCEEYDFAQNLKRLTPFKRGEINQSLFGGLIAAKLAAILLPLCGTTAGSVRGGVVR